MLTENGDGTYTGGPFDIITVLHDTTTDRFHAALFCEAPPPGPVEGNPETIRLRSEMHHTKGADTLDEAKKHLNGLATKIRLPKENVIDEPLDWNGQIGVTLLVRNWRGDLAKRAESEPFEPEPPPTSWERILEGVL